MLDIYTVDRQTNEKEILLSCPLWDRDSERELDGLKDEELGKALVLNLFKYKENHYDDIYQKAYDAFQKGDEPKADNLLRGILDERADFFNDFEERVGASANHFMKMKVYDFNIAPYILLGYMKEVNWNRYTVTYEIGED